ncbi:MAG: ABC transporter ATP-binding protein [Candidatus Thermoplasmatota archaeon]
MVASKSKNVIKVENLTKLYNNVPAVKDLSFSVERGEVFGFLGPNGAGKTTTIKAMLGLIYSDNGLIEIKGNKITPNVKHVKKEVGYLPEIVAFYDNLTGLQNLHFYAELKNTSKSECSHLLSDMGLGDAGDKKVGGYSKGMKQRLGMARAMLGSPSLLILDEPTGGLDPKGVRLIREKIKQLNKNGVTVFISSHILSEIQAVCSQVGIIKKGELVAQDSVSSLSKKANVKPKMFLVLAEVTDEIKKEVEQVDGVDNVEVRENIVEVVCKEDIRSKVIVAVEKAGGKIDDIRTAEASLEDVFMKYTEG